MATNIDRALEPSLIPGLEPGGVQEMDTIEIEIENPDSVTVGTDGLEVTAADLGGPYRDGLLVVQDGRNNLPRAPQWLDDFKSTNYTKHITT
jgi:myo-inositol-hexaphosphate 3-phosphohydrolase